MWQDLKKTDEMNSFLLDRIKDEMGNGRPGYRNMLIVCEVGSKLRTIGLVDVFRENTLGYRKGILFFFCGGSNDLPIIISILRLLKKNNIITCCVCSVENVKPTFKSITAFCIHNYVTFIEHLCTVVT